MLPKRKMPFCFRVLFFTLLPNLLCPQTIIVSDSVSIGTFGTSAAYRAIDIGQCQTDLIHDGFAYKIFDIFVDQNGGVWRYGLALGFLIHFFSQMLNGGANYDYLTIDQDKEGWTCDEYGNNYSAGTGITKNYTPIVFGTNDTEQYLGGLPPNMECKGGLTYRGGKFYLHSINNQLVEVNMKDPMQSKVIMDFPSGILPIDALTTVQVGCDSSITYAIGRTPSNSKIYEIDFSGWTLTEVCDLPISITGAGAQTECMLPPCNIFIDLDNDNSSFGFRGNYCADTFCVPPVMVSDTDVVIVSAFDMVGSVTLELAGAMDFGQEYLTAGTADNINITGNNTTLLTFANNGNATIADFEDAIETVLYHNDAAATTFGMRKVMVSGFAGGESSLVSVTELPLSNEQMETLALAVDPTCHGFANGSINVSSKGGVAPYSYQWEIPQHGDFVENLLAGEYPFVVIDSLGCSISDTVFLNDPDTLIADISYTGLPAICNDSGQLEGIGSGGTGMLSYQWSNGMTDSLNNDIEAGSYTLIVQDTNGCTATDTYEIPMGDTVLLVQDEVICDGKNFTWNNFTYTSDTLVCQVFTMANGCDSTACLSLKVNPSPVVSIITDGDFCETGQLSLSAGNHDSYIWTTGEIEGQINISNAGGYTVTVTNGLGCTSDASVSINLPISFNLSYKSPSCYGQEDGEIIFENTSGGSPPFLHSIDGGNQFYTNGQFNSLPAGGYNTVVVDADDCRIETPVVLVLPPIITVEAGNDQEVDLGEGITLNAFTDLSDPTITWQPSDYLECPICLHTDGLPLTSIQYELVVRDSNGCAVSDIVNITVNDRSSIYAPNVFSPNNDGINDFFAVHSNVSITAIPSLKVFDRWGNMVFSGTNLTPNKVEDGWDGMHKDKPAHSGIYVFVAEVQKVGGTVEVVSGEVVLIR